MRAVTWSRHQEIVSLDEGRKGEQCEFRILEVQMFDAGIGCGTHVISQQEGHFKQLHVPYLWLVVRQATCKNPQACVRSKQYTSANIWRYGR